MTRGKLVLITGENGNCIVSPEFNGDMYYEKGSPGKKAYDLLKRGDCSNKERFREIVLEFLRDYKYIEEYTDEEIKDLVFIRNRNVVEHNFNQSRYFEHWFSDYIYVKNISGSDVKTTDYNGDELTIENGETMILHFGRKFKPSSVDSDWPPKLKEIDGSYNG